MAYEEQLQQSSYSKYECLLFDLDDTLYPYSSGLSLEVTKSIQEYMTQKLHIKESEVPEMCISLYKNYGTTMAGLRAVGYNFDYDDFHGFVHGRLPYNMLKPDPVLRQLLLSVPLRKLIFTNADKAHAARVLKRLGLEDCFDGIICFETLNDPKQGNDSVNSSTGNIERNAASGNAPGCDSALPVTPVVCKPFEQAFEEVFKIAKINPQKTLFFDDSFRNLQTGKQTGLHTVLIGSSQRMKGADHALESIHNIREAFPELWETNESSKGVTYSRKVSIETPVRA
ncbi:uncharacterized protein C24B11.05-like [Punica granatum]|uniref:Uncharacterized protein C24B11.05-like n=2 Tax=Punica granatum TaxID=22663 RepID=A0A6P8CQW3_PUNGR|nr:uncharacterized protein C24B11.05-like [Punica granatum]XP_031384695.1 uncharacterized protein C24B11.05-like [Punica granatum]PKI48696.1 hypothetical protein CRG98_030913 [Punica granatum]